MLIDRRLCKVKITIEAFVDLVKTGAEIHARVVSGVPEDVELEECYFDRGCRAFAAVFKHPSFDIVPFGAAIPELVVSSERLPCAVSIDA